MPKYRAQDFVAEALQRRRSLLDRMLVASPHHIEFVDAYVHKGQLEDSLYSKPWMLDCFISWWDGGVSPLQDEGEAVEAVLARLLEGCCIRTEGLEEFADPLPSAPSITSDGFGSQVDLLLSQEIDLAMKRHAHSSPGSPGDGGRGAGLQGCGGEEFPEENIHSRECGIEPACEPWLLEPLLSPSHLDCVLGRLPLVVDLTGRLRPRMIQDPLAVDGAGRLHSYSTTCSPQFSQDSPLTNPPRYEEFSCETLPTKDGKIDLVLGLPLTPTDLEDPLEGAARLKLPALPSPLTDLPTDENLRLESREELKMLASAVQASGVPDPPVQFPDFSPAEEMEQGATDFVQLNDANVSRDSEDSGIGGITNAFLESPCLPLASSPLTTPLSHQLGALEPLPLSPSDKLVLMSPASEQRLVKRMWEREKVFDSILALTLPYPDIEEATESRTECPVPVPAEALQLLALRPIELDGDCELELPWDPLAESHRDMTLAQRQLWGCPYLAEGKKALLGGTAWREGLERDSSVRKHLEMGLFCRYLQLPHDAGEDADLPVSVEADRIHIPLQTDVPSLGLEQLLVQRAANEGRFPLTTLAHTSFACTRASRSKSKQSSGWSSMGTGARSRDSVGLELASCGVSALETFMMLRSGTARYKRRASVRLEEELPERKKKAAAVHLNDQNTATELWDSEERESKAAVTSSTIRNVCLSGTHQSVLVQLERFAAPLLAALKPFGLPSPGGFWGLPPDRAKFFLKQQQKALEDSRGAEGTDSIQSSCRHAACLYVLCSLADTVLHCGITAGLEGLTPVKQELLTLQLNGRMGGAPTHHPKLPRLVRVVSRWAEGDRRGGREKAVVIVEREFSSLSGDILDFLQSIPDLKSCVFSFAPNGSTDPLYLDAVEERLHHYDCLVMPAASLAGLFPWEKVGLLVEFEELKTPLFPGGPPRGVMLQEYVTLRAVREVSASALADQGLRDQDLSSLCYTFMASENVTRHTQLLQLLEGRHNVMVIERDYQELKRHSLKPKSVSFADLTLDASAGVILRPLSLLSSDLGLKSLVSCTNALSMQYQTCWVILFVQDESSYPFGGCVPINLARLHASVAHYSQRRDGYEVRVLCASSVEEAALITRRVAEETHRRAEAWSHEDWNVRGWLAEEMTVHERFLLGFPCFNTFSAQLMLQQCALGHLLAMGVPQLQASFPCIPEKVLKLFHRMCNINCGSSELAALPPPRVNDPDLPISGGGGVGELGGLEIAGGDPREGTVTGYQLGVGSNGCPRRREVSPLGGGTTSVGLDCVGELDTSAGFTDDVTLGMIAMRSEETNAMIRPSDDESQTLTLGSGLDDSLEFTNQVNHSNPHLVEEHNIAFTDGCSGVSAVGQTSTGSFASSLFDCENLADDDRRESLISMNRRPSGLELRGPISPSFSSNGHSSSWSQPQADDTGCPDVASTVIHPLGFSAARAHKTASQKEIRDTVIGKLSSSFPFGSASLEASSNTARLGREYYSGMVSSRFIAGSAARQTPARNPVKSLDLGFDSLGGGQEQRLELQSNDRAITVPSRTERTASHGRSDQSSSSSAINAVEFQSLKDRAGTLFAPRGSRVPDLKAFHSQERQRAHRSWDHTRTESCGPSQRKTAIDSWLGIPCIMAKAIGQKRPYTHGPTSDGMVPLATVSPPGAEPSLYGSPNTSTGSITLSPNRKRRLIYEKVPGSSGGQTRLSFR